MTEGLVWRMTSTDGATENGAPADVPAKEVVAEPAKDEAAAAPATTEGDAAAPPAEGGEGAEGAKAEGAEGEGAEGAEGAEEEGFVFKEPEDGIAVTLEGYPEDFPPKGCRPLDVSDSTLQRWEMKWGEMIGESYQSYYMDKALIVEECDKQGVACDFYCFAKQLKKYSHSDKLFLVKAPSDNPLDVNYLWIEKKEPYEHYTAQIAETRAKMEAEQLAVYEEAQAAAKAAKREAAGEDGEVVEEEFEEDMTIDVTFEDKPLIPRPWEDLGASVEVDYMTPSNTRALLGFYISQERRHYKQRCDFSSFDVEKPPYYNHQKVQNHNLRRLENDLGFQCAVGQKDRSTQTLWRTKYNKACQYEPITYTENLQKKVMKSAKMAKFVRRSLDLIELNLQQNETLDLFKGEFDQFQDEEFSLGNKKENNLKAWHSFTDLTYSKNRIISSINWHPTKSGVVAFSCTNNLTFDQWVDVSGKVLTSSILIWNFQDLLRPQYVLMAPGDMICFSINPINPNLIVGGLQTGQLVLWDLTEQNRKAEMNKKNDALGDKETHTVTIAPLYISQIDRSHSRGVTDIMWLPTNAYLNKRGEYSEVHDAEYPYQFCTVAGDGHLLLWDSRPHQFKNPNWVSKEEAEGVITWTAHASLPLTRPDSSGTICATRISESDGTTLVMVTEDGEVSVIDYACKSNDEKKNAVVKCTKGHVGACTAVRRSPHFPDTYLTVGDWTFVIWKIDQKEPVFKSAPAAHHLTTGCWSPSRPGLLCVARSDGTIEVWDLLDQCHKPSLMFPSGSEEITSMAFWQAKLGPQQYLAVGDNEGKLHIIEIPRNLRKTIPHEDKLMQSFYDREIKRVKYAAERKQIRASEKVPPPMQEEKKEKTDAEAETLQLGNPVDAAASEEEMLAEQDYQKQLKEWTEKLCDDDAES